MNKARYKLNMTVFCLFLFSITTFAKLDKNKLFNTNLSQTWRWNNFTNMKGLPPSVEVRYFIESNDGISYVITDGGIYWFDNYLWQQVLIDGVNFKGVINVKKDKEDGISVLYKNVIYEVNKSKVLKLDLKVPLTVKSYTSAVELGNEEYLLTGFNSNTKKIFIEFYNKGKFINFYDSIKIEEKEKNVNNYLLDESGGVLIHNEENTYYWRRDVGKKIIPGLNKVINFTQLSVKKDGTLYINCYNPKDFSGFYHFNPFTQKLTKTNLELNRFVTGHENNDGVYYSVMTNNKVYYTLDGLNFLELENANQLLFDATEISFTQDGNLWVAQHDQIYYVTLNVNNWDFHLNINEISNLNVNSIIKSKYDNSLWLATSIGVYQIKDNKVKSKYLSFKNEKFQGVTSIIEDKLGNIYFCAGGYFDYVYRIKNKQIEKLDEKYGVPKSRYHRIVQDKKQNLWFLAITKLSYDHGLGAFCFDGNKVIYNYNTNNGLVNGRIYDMEFGKAGDIWFSTYVGVSHRNNKGNWKHYVATKKDEPIQNINTICIDSTGKVWLNIGKNSLGYIDNTGLHESKILNNFMIKEVQEIKVAEDNQLWISTLNGLYIYSNDSNNILRRISKSQGLSNNKLWDFHLDKDSIILGTFGNGIATYYYKLENQHFPRLFIHNEKVIDDKFTCIVSGYSYKSRVRNDYIYYRFRIDGGNWSEFTNRKIIEIDNLKYGNHKIELQSYNANGTLNTKLESITFECVPPLYRDLRFIIPMLLVIGYIAWLINQNFQRKKHERESIKQLNLELEDRIEQKTKDLSIALELLKVEQDKTELALKEEKDLHELKTKFIEMVSHEYRTPLTVIMASAYIIEKLGTDSQKYDRIKEALVQIETAVNILTGYIDDSLSLGNRPMTIKSITDFNEVDLVELCLSIIKKHSKRENVFIDFKHSKDIKVNSNWDMITTIVNNFLNNSITYNRNNNTIELLLDYEGQYPVIIVKDKGLGIEEKDKQEIFKPFFRSKEHIGLLPGTGLGLSISKKLAEEIGGQIVFESKYGVGSTFKLILPIDI